MSMPEMVCVSVPPCPIQKVFWCSFSVTRIGSIALSPMSSGRSTPSAASTRRASVKTLPTPIMPVIGLDDHQGMNGILGLDFVASNRPWATLPNRPRLSTDRIFKSEPPLKCC